MATKTLYNNPTVNPFQALHIDEEPEQRTAKPQPSGKKAAQAQPQVKTPQTPAERAKRREAVKATQQAQVAAAKKAQEAEAALAAMMGPDDGFILQKAPKKREDTFKQKVQTREEYEQSGGQSPQPGEAGQPRKQYQNKDGKNWSGPRKDGSDKGTTRDFQKQDGQQRRDGQQQQRKPYSGTKPQKPAGEWNTDNSGNTSGSSRPPRHDGYDKHSAGKTGAKPYQKRKDQGAGNWGNPTSDWAQAGSTDSPAEPAQPGWGDEGAKEESAAPAAGGWGDEGEPKSPAEPAAGGWGGDDKKDEPEKEEREPANLPPREPAWDEVEGHGKVLLAQYQKTVAAAKAAELEKIVGVKVPRTIEQPADMSKFSYRESEDEKAKKVAQKPEDKKKKPQRSEKNQVDLSAVFEVRTRGGAPRGGRGGGPRPDRGDRPPRQEGDRPDRGDRPPRQEGERPDRADRPPRQEGQGQRSGGYQGNSHRVPTQRNAFPDLGAPAAAKPAQSK